MEIRFSDKMSEWRLHERVKLAAEGRRWKLSEEEQFSVGRNTECDIVLQVSEL